MQQSFSNEPSQHGDQAYPLTFSQRAVYRDLRGIYMAILLHPHPDDHERSRSGGFIPGMGGTGNTDDCRASKQGIIYFINNRKCTFLRLGSKCREHKHSVAYVELGDGPLTMYISYRFAYVARCIGGTVGATVTIWSENIFILALRIGIFTMFRYPLYPSGCLERHRPKQSRCMIVRDICLDS